MRLAICSKSGDVLEPMITPQWYIKCDEMAEKAKIAVRNGSLKIIPAEHETAWFQWLDNIRDWCVSRQIWWGHQIPAWFVTKAGEHLDKNDMENKERWIVARNEEVSCLYPSLIVQRGLSYSNTIATSRKQWCLRRICFGAPWPT
jgi:valyl-tRNA synthetase